MNVSSHCYNLGIKGQSQIYLESVLQLVTRNPISFNFTEMLIFSKIIACD